MTPKYLAPLISLILALAAVTATDAHAAKGASIKKCQDETGKWHYGDTAAEECAKSKVIVITETGTKRKEIAAPPTEEELKERERHKEEVEREKLDAADRAKKDELLLSTYGHEQDIIYVRDRKLAQVESSIGATEATLQSLRAVLTRMEAQAADDKDDKAASEQSTKAIAQTRAQIAKHEAYLATRKQEQEDIRKQTEQDLARYRELKNRAPGGAAPGAKPR